MKYIGLSGKLAKGACTIVDDDDYGALSSRKWHLATNGYAIRYAYVGPKNGRSNYSPVMMHRAVLNAPKGTTVDHINGNKLDNRKSNLRLCTQEQNCRNSRRRVQTVTGYKGIYRNSKGRYVARITVSGTCHYIGSSEDPALAAGLYDAAALQFFGEFANTNVL